MAGHPAWALRAGRADWAESTWLAVAEAASEKKTFLEIIIKFVFGDFPTDQTKNVNTLNARESGGERYTHE